MLTIVHQIITMRIWLSLCMSKTLQRKKNYDWSKLRNTELQELHAINTVRNRFAVLSNNVDDVTQKSTKALFKLPLP